MNSHQRRKNRREWKYVVQVYSQEWDHYIGIFKWCQQNFGITVASGWQDPRPTFDTRWKFNCPKKAAAFAMRWQ